VSAVALAPHDPVRVMVIDDDDKFRDLLSRILRDDGFDVAAADSAGTAVAGIADADPDVVVIDYTLGDADGLRLADDIVAERPQQRVIIFSSIFDLALRRVTEQRGFAYVEKVDGVDVLESTIRATVGA
jgi:two-component system response regulator HydG